MNKESFNIVAGETTEGSIVSNTTARISFNNMDFSNCILIYDSNNGRMDYEYFGYDGNDVWFAPGVYDFTLIPNNEMAICEAKAVTIYPDTVNALDFSKVDVTPIESTETFGPGNVKIRIDEKVLLPDKTFLKFNFSDSYYGNAAEQFIRLESRDFYMESENKIQLIPVCIDPDFKISLSKGDQGELVITIDREIENPGYLEITYTSSSSDAYGTARNEYNRPMGNTIVGRTAPEKRILKVEPGAYDFSNWYWSNNMMPILSETHFSVLPGETKKIEYSVEYDERF